MRPILIPAVLAALAFCVSPAMSQSTAPSVPNTAPWDQPFLPPAPEWDVVAAVLAPAGRVVVAFSVMDEDAAEGIADDADIAVRRHLESETALGLHMRDEQARGCGGTRVGWISRNHCTVGDREAADGTGYCRRLRYQWQAVLRLGWERAESGRKQRRRRQPAPGISVRGCTHVDCSLYRLLTAAGQGM